MSKLGAKIYKIDDLYAVAIFNADKTFATGMILETPETAEKYAENWCGTAWSWE